MRRPWLGVKHVGKSGRLCTTTSSGLILLDVSMVASSAKSMMLVLTEAVALMVSLVKITRHPKIGRNQLQWTRTVMIISVLPTVGRDLMDMTMAHTVNQLSIATTLLQSPSQLHIGPTQPRVFLL